MAVCCRGGLFTEANTYFSCVFRTEHTLASDRRALFEFIGFPNGSLCGGAWLLQLLQGDAFSLMHRCRLPLRRLSLRSYGALFTRCESCAFSPVGFGRSRFRLGRDWAQLAPGCRLYLFLPSFPVGARVVVVLCSCFEKVCLGPLNV